MTYLLPYGVAKQPVGYRNSKATCMVTLQHRYGEVQSTDGSSAAVHRLTLVTLPKSDRDECRYSTGIYTAGPPPQVRRFAADYRYVLDACIHLRHARIHLLSTASGRCHSVARSSCSPLCSCPYFTLHIKAIYGVIMLCNVVTSKLPFQPETP